MSRTKRLTMDTTSGALLAQREHVYRSHLRAGVSPWTRRRARSSGHCASATRRRGPAGP
jgi:hypothetical protein